MPASPESVRFTWAVAEGYYLYRDKFSFSSVSDDVKIDKTAIRVPRGKVKQDESFGDVEVNTGLVAVDVPLLNTGTGISEALFRVGYQGCKEGSVCYPPQLKGDQRRLWDRSCNRCRTSRQPGATFRPGQDYREAETGQSRAEYPGVFCLWRIAVIDPLRIPDDPHPVGHHRRSARESNRAARFCPVSGLRPRHGADLLPAGRAGRFVPAQPAGCFPECLGDRCVQHGIRSPGAGHVRFL